jgi:ferric-dicitrate binding protein FerR (iron transport regulator)
MNSGNQHIVQLLEKFSRGEASPADTDQLLSLLQQQGEDEKMIAFMEQQLNGYQPENAEELAYWKEKLKEGAAAITGITEENTARPVHRMQFLRKWGWAAAAVIVTVSVGAYLYTNNSSKPAAPAVVAQATHIAPGKSGAVLTLADGSQVVLDSLGNGMVATQNGSQVILKGGELAYAPAGTASGETTYNTMTTPKGRQFQLTLPDGTRVWLNAASSLRYPTAFNGNERLVAVTGEAYFEVARNNRQPFKVMVNEKATVEVLGTSFNVNAYDNETSIQTTLLNGSVRVANINTAQSSAVTLKPGQQASLNNHAANNIKVINDIDINKVMSWKNGLFNFEGANLGEVMRQIERWYDIEVVYEKGIPNVEFEGKMTKDVPLKDLLTMLDRSDVHFRIENRKLIVLP